MAERDCWLLLLDFYNRPTSNIQFHGIMGLPALLRPKCPIKTSSFLLPFCFVTDISTSSRFSSLCRRHHFPQPQQAPTPPVPKKIPFEVSAHGRTWQDPYRWMSNTKDPDLSKYLDLENSYAEAFMAGTQNLQRTLFSEMIQRMPTKVSTPPERWGPWFAHSLLPISYFCQILLSLFYLFVYLFAW